MSWHSSANLVDFVCLRLSMKFVLSPIAFLLFGEEMTISPQCTLKSWLLSAPGNQICSPPATTQLCPSLLSTTKPVWPPHQSNYSTWLHSDCSSACLCLWNPLCAFFSAAGPFCGYLISCAAACGLWLDCDVFVLAFKTSVAIYSGGCDPCMCVSDRKERSLLRGFTVN